MRGRKPLRMEYFYREMRKRHDVLMQGDTPEGGRWNFDEDLLAFYCSGDTHMACDHADTAARLCPSHPAHEPALQGLSV